MRREAVTNDVEKFIAACSRMEYLILPILERVTDTASLREFTKEMPRYELVARTGSTTYSFAYRMLVEAIMDGDGDSALKAAEKANKQLCELFEYFPKSEMSIENQMLEELPLICRDRGMEACMQALKKVRDANMRRLKKGGVV